MSLHTRIIHWYITGFYDVLHIMARFYEALLSLGLILTSASPTLVSTQN